jgi:AraC-like DNA-binding protein
MSRVHNVIQHRSAIAGVEAMTLFSDHTFPRHSHDQYGIGIMTSGVQRSWSVMGEVESRGGDVIMVNPGEMHDGRPADRRSGCAARGWRILYFDPKLIAREMSDELLHGEFVVQPVARDRELAREVQRLFAHVEHSAPDPLAAEESLLSCLRIVAQQHRVGGPPATYASPSVIKAVQRLDRAPEEPTSLSQLAALSGLSRFQLLRGFAREVGTTPHAYLVQRRVRLARRLLASGSTPGDAAVRAGFADQSHMTRAFVRHFGITPARYKAALT